MVGVAGAARLMWIMSQLRSLLLRDWIPNHEISFPALLKDAIEEAFGQWLENHSTQIIVQIAKSYAGLSPESARQR